MEQVVCQISFNSPELKGKGKEKDLYWPQLCQGGGDFREIC